jgi:hypothetical protein
MIRQIQLVKKAAVQVLCAPYGALKMLAASAVIFFILLGLPVLTTPGNDFAFEWMIMSWPTRILLIALSLGNGLLFAMHMHGRQHGQRTGVKHAAAGAGILTASLASTLACAACYSSILAVFGLSGAAFVVTNRWWFAGEALLLTAFAIYNTSRKVTGVCSAACAH